MKYVGGYTRSSDILDRYKYDTLSSFKAQLRITEQQHTEQKVDYSIGIKTKRLYDSQIK